MLLEVITSGRFWCVWFFVCLGFLWLLGFCFGFLVFLEGKAGLSSLLAGYPSVCPGESLFKI